MAPSYSFGAKKPAYNSLALLKTDVPAEPTQQSGTVSLEILKSGLTANNTFYLRFGDKDPFNFFHCYPVDSTAELVQDKSTSHDEFVHPPAWGVAQVVASTIDEIVVGTKYLGHLPIATSVTFKDVSVNEEGNMVVKRPKVDAAYNVFRKIDPDDALLTEEYGDLALVCWPGIMTGFGCFSTLQMKGYYGADNLVITSASSKVALALAFYLKDSGKNVVGYTSKSNVPFCQSTGLYSQILDYDADLDPEKKYVFIDIVGRSDIYSKNKSCVTKLIAIGNTVGATGKDVTFGLFPPFATLKFLLTILGAPRWTRSWMNPVHDLYLVLDGHEELKEDWGLDKYKTLLKENTHAFCKNATFWITTHKCDTEDAIKKGFADVIEGKVAPSQAVILDVRTATRHK